MTIKEKIFFNYDGIWSNDFNLLHVQLDSGMYEETLIAGREIVETKINGKDKPLFSHVDNSPLEFDMHIAFSDRFDQTKLSRVVAWLVQDHYKPLYFEGEENRVFYCMADGDTTITHDGMGGGYISLHMRCNSPFVYSPVLLSEHLDLSVSSIGEVNIFYDGYGFLYPDISIVKVGAGSVRIRNVNNGNEVFELTGLDDGEDIYISTEKEIIQSDAESVGIYRYNNASGEFTRLTPGHNRIEVEGRCRIQFRYQFKYRF